MQIFWIALVDHASAEADDRTALVVDRKHDAVAETVVAPAFLAGNYQPGLSQRIRLVLGEHRLQVLPAVRRIAEAITRGNFAGQSALLQIANGFVRRLQLGLVTMGGLQ